MRSRHLSDIEIYSMGHESKFLEAVADASVIQVQTMGAE